MRSMRLIDRSQPPRLAEATMPRPQAKDGEVLVQVVAAGITSAEPLWYPTSHTKDGTERDGAVLSHEFSGKVAQLARELPDWLKATKSTGRMTGLPTGRWRNSALPGRNGSRPSRVASLMRKPLPSRWSAHCLAGAADPCRPERWRARADSRCSGCSGNFRGSVGPASRRVCDCHGFCARYGIREGPGRTRSP